MRIVTSWLRRGSSQRYLLPTGLIVLALWLISLSIESWTYWHRVVDQLTRATLVTTRNEKVTPAPINFQNIATIFGAVPAEFDSSPVGEPLRLLASLQGNQSDQSRALIQYADTRAFYSTGDRLPDGSRIEHIGKHKVALVRAGREHNLLLPGRELRLLRLQKAPSEIPAHQSTTLLQAIESPQ